MFDNLSPRLRHMGFSLLGAVLTVLLPWLAENAPALIGDGVARLPQPWAGFAAPVVAAFVTALIAQLTIITRQYGVGEDMGADSLTSDGLLPASNDLNPDDAPTWVELPDPANPRRVL